MASYIKRGESLFIPFWNGLSISDSQIRPRIYKSTEQFEKHFPGYYKGLDGVELVEYAEVVRCKDCKHFVRNSKVNTDRGDCYFYGIGCLRAKKIDDFCSYGERKEGDQS